MKRKLLFICALVVSGFNANAQVTDLEGPMTWKSQLRTDNIDTKVMRGFDAGLVAEQDAVNDLDLSLIHI